MGVHKTSNQFTNESGSVKDTGPVSTFGNQATGFSSGFGRQTNTVFGTFPNQQQQSTTNNSAAFGSQNTFGSNFFHNTGFFQSNNFGFGHTMSQQTTKICFTGFGEPKTNYCFTSSFATMKKVTLIFEHPDTIFGSSIFKKPSTIVEIEALPLSNLSSWISNNNHFSFSARTVEKYNSIFIMKSANPIKFLVKVKQPDVGFNNTMSPSMNYENRKITLTFQSDQPQYIPNTNILRPMETIVEVPLPITKYDPMSTFSNEGFMFFAGPNSASNSFEVQTSKNAVFIITFAEKGKHNNNQLFGNRQTRSGSVFFDQGRQMNAFPTTSGTLFGQAPSVFGGNEGFGSSTTNQIRPMNSTQPINGSLFAKPSGSNGSGFGTNQLFGGSTTGTVAGTDTVKLDKSRPHTGGFLFGQTNKCFGSQQTSDIGSVQLFGNLEQEATSSIQPSIGSTHSQACGLGSNQFSCTIPSTLPDEVTSVENNVRNDFKSVHYRPTFGSDAIANQLGHMPTKSNCITAMSEYANESFEELRYQDYLRNSSELSKQNNTITKPGRTEELANSSANKFGGYSPSHNMIGNTNQAFFDQLHQLIPYLNAGSFCKCVRSCTNAAAKSQNNGSTSANSQPKTNSDSLDHLYVNTQKPRLNDNMTIDEFYDDVFKYLDYIQKQYRHLESTLNNKNASNIPNDQHSNKSDTQKKAEESNETSNQYTHHTKSPMPVFGCSNYSAVNTGLNENTSSINAGSENDDPTIEKVSGIESKKGLLFGTSDVSNKVALSTSPEQLEATTAIEQNLDTSDDDAAKIKSKTEDHSNSSVILKPQESNRDSNLYTQTLSVPLFGACTSVNPSSENNSSTVSTVSNIFGSSAISADGTTLSSCTTTENTKNNNDVEPTKSLFVGTDLNNKITLGTSKPFGLKFFSLPVPSQMPENTTSAPIFSTKDISSSSIGPIFTAKDTSSNSTEPIFSGKDVGSSSTGPIFSAKDISSSSIPILSAKNIRSSSIGPIASAKNISSSNAGPIFSAKDISSSSIGPIFPAKDISTNSTGLTFSIKDTNSSSQLKNNSTGLFSFAVASKIPKNTSTTSFFSTEEKSSSATVGQKSTGFFSLTFPNNKYTTPIFSTKETTSPSTTVGEKSVALFSQNILSQMPDNTLTTSSSTVGEKSTGFFSFNIPSNKSDGSIFATKDSTSSSTVGGHLPGLFSMNAPTNKPDNKDEIESNAKTINLSNSDIADSQANDSNNGGFYGGVKADEPLRSFISYKKTQGSSPEEIDVSMDVQSGIVSSQQVFKMKEISNILAEINDSEETRKDSLTKSETDSDISNYSLISNRSANASPIRTDEHPTGIVMTRYGYYILPSLEDLKSQMTEDGACVVPNFTIGRKGYGSVCFNKEINVAGLNVDDIVHFRNKEIIIYPNKNTKPQLIADLKNCDVLVTLEQVWPHDQTKHEPIKDPLHLDKIKYENKLRLVCHRNDIHFVDYRPETGSWLFKMKQFTKNNINCWDVEDEDETRK